MLALVGRPSLHGSDGCMIYWNKAALRRNSRQKYGATSFSLSRVFLFCRSSRVRFWGLILWHLWLGRAQHPGPAPTSQVGIEVFNVGEWLTHGDLALEAKVDFWAVVEHCLIPARVGSEWARLRIKGLASLWAPACQDSSHVGTAGVGIISMRVRLLLCLPLPLPSSSGSLIVVGRFGACFLLVLVGFCTWLSCTVTRELMLMLMLSSLL